MKNNNNIEIFTGEQVKSEITTEQLDYLSNLWAEYDFENCDLPLEEKDNFLIMFRNHLQEVLENGDLTIAKKEGLPIGMVRLVKLLNFGQSDYVNGDVYEIGKSILIPSERGKGIYKKMQKIAVDEALKKYGNISILTGTQKEAIKKLRHEEGWNEIGFAEYLRIHGANEDYIRNFLPTIEREGWTAFLI